jgi:hypothetical protein
MHYGRGLLSSRMWKEVDIIKTDRVRTSDIGGDFNNEIFC